MASAGAGHRVVARGISAAIINGYAACAAVNLGGVRVDS
jgi:hypothetical protein